ncbi:ACD11 homolog protein-like [Impatiens glandulifera]|uniref:ACD11 homolog protein-like n=1 Tax=Impatiens glandulifera TaxID=253017 RepID=UPI001FB195AF|nr:ACD11 homolog protein-like [Impatiens glandulifera]
MALKYLFNRTMSMPDMVNDNPAFVDNSDDTKQRPLSAVAEAFEDLSKMLNSTETSPDVELKLKPFCDACSLVSVLFGCLGMAFRFAELEYVSKVHNLVEAGKRYETLSSMLDIDVRNDTVRTAGSNSRNLRRVRQGLDLIRAIFQNFLSPEFCSLKDAASTAYADVCAPYHTWAVRTAAYAGMCVLPTREQLLLKLNATDELAEKEMNRYIKASQPVIEFIDKLYMSRDISLDW